DANASPSARKPSGANASGIRAPRSAIDPHSLPNRRNRMPALDFGRVYCRERPLGQSQTGPTLCKIRVKRGVGGDSFASKRQALTVAAMWLLAVTTLEKLKAVPTKHCVNLVLAPAAGHVASVRVRRAARINRLGLAQANHG